MYNVRFGSDFFRIEAKIVKEAKSSAVVMKVRPGKLKDVSVNGKSVDKLAGHIGFQPVVILSPGDQSLIEGASAERRRFMDFYLSQTDRSYLRALMQYNRTLHQRNALLKTYGRNTDGVLLKSYSEKMAPLALEISDARRSFLATLNPLVINLTEKVSNMRDHVSLEYKSDLRGLDFMDVAESTLDHDMILGRTSRGVHRDDMIFKLEDGALRRFGSQGQRKSYLIALHLALRDFLVNHTDNAPLILLDDIFDKLDDERVISLLNILGQDDYGQVFITDARDERVSDICTQLKWQSKVFTIEDGKITGEEEFNLEG
ncbi:MAG: DNA replication and repair protein RecF [Bacteroidetes bacterium]|nr:MAG: DNA replication and repair protein RecF [Bacteroidota bacterium]